MSDYNLNGLNNRDFEHLTQSLALEAISKGVTPFGDGPDGGREASYDGKMHYPSVTDSWNGYLVIQSKFRARPSLEPEENAKWILNQLKKDLLKFEDPKRKLKKPEYYIVVTNVVLTPAQGVGSKDKVFSLLKDHQSKIGYKSFDVWDFDKLCRLLDNYSSIRNSFAGFITSGDVLTKAIEGLKEQHPDFSKIISVFLQNEILSDQYVKLEQAGHHAEHKTLLAQVFVDLPVSEYSINDASRNDQELDRYSSGIVNEILEVGSQRLKRSLTSVNLNHLIEPGRFVVIGGPGQGKSTIGQFVCQIYRAAILKDQPLHTLSSESISTLSLFTKLCDSDFNLPIVRRFPFRVVLDQFATDLANGKVKSLLSFVLNRINRRIDSNCSLDDLRRWLATYPWIIILDGLDEVPVSSNRQQVLDKVQDFWTEVASLDADVLVIATTRPQGYNEEFSPKYYNHRYLVPLTQSRAMHYAGKLAEAQYGVDLDRKERVLMRLKMACEQDTTRRLMRSPLQVTIMATLVDKIGQPPQERWRLFQQYYEVIYQRETERDIPTSRILQQRKTEVNAIHYRVGLLLQKESEKAGKTESRLPADRFEKLVYARIEEEGFEGLQLQERTKEITDAALHRLVFLVGLQEDKIGFEIRSLQEFMAAEALMEGIDEHVRARLDSIAPISHWRNVFLFAAGKCFADRQSLRDMIIQICEQLNDPVNDKLSGVTLAGSRLALDILIDGVAREQPKYARSLARIAIRLIELQDIELCRSLGSIYENSFEELYKSEIVKKFSQKSFTHKIGAWATLRVLIEQEINWAIELAETNWPEEVNQQEEILMRDRMFLKGDWSIIKFLELVPSVSPWRIFRIPVNIGLKKIKVESLPEWFLTLKDYFSDHLDGNQNNVAPFLVHKKVKHLNLIYGPVSFAFANFKDFPLINKQWAPFVAAAKFSECPSQRTLSEQLRWLGTECDFELIKAYIRKDFGWPLVACLLFSENSSDLFDLASKVDEGLLGSIEDWIAAENRWKVEGVKESDLLYTATSSLPFDNNVGTIGFPIASSYLSNESRDSLQVWNCLQDIHTNIPKSYVRNHIAGFMLNLSIYDISRNDKKVSLEPELLKQLFIEAFATRSFYHFSGLIKLPKVFNQQWLEFFNWLGLQENNVYLADLNIDYVKQLYKGFVQNSSLKGLIHVLSSLRPPKEKVRIPVQLLSGSNFDDFDTKFHALQLRLMQGEWDSKELKKLVKYCMELIQNKDFLLYHIVYAIRRTYKFRQDGEPFLLSILDELSKVNFLNTTSVEEALNDLMRSRTSLLNKKSHWEELGLPELE
ncbi:MAG: NACHT domain-containing protein [Adhaeribacter sp.]